MLAEDAHLEGVADAERRVGRRRNRAAVLHDDGLRRRAARAKISKARSTTNRYACSILELESHVNNVLKKLTGTVPGVAAETVSMRSTC